MQMHGAQLSRVRFPDRVLAREPKELLHPPEVRAAGVRAVRVEEAPAAVKVVDRAAVDRADKFSQMDHRHYACSENAGSQRKHMMPIS